jgi:protein gp37
MTLIISIVLDDLRRASALVRFISFKPVQSPVPTSRYSLGDRPWRKQAARRPMLELWMDETEAMCRKLPKLAPQERERALLDFGSKIS